MASLHLYLEMPLEKKTLFGPYTVAEVSAETFYDFYAAKSAEVYPDVLQINTDIWLSREDKAARHTLSQALQHRIALYFLIYCGDEPIGWHSGYQIDSETFYMFESGIIPAYQSRGIYTTMLSWLLDKYRSLGFQKVTSQHHASNNAVIVPKLKAGFFITGFTIDEGVGVMISLAYIFNSRRLQAYHFRTGYSRPDTEIRKFL